MSKTKDRGSFLQFEISRKRWDAMHITLATGSQDTAIQRLYSMASTAACDTVRNGGTFVLVVSPETITMVQRPDAETFDTPEQTK